MRNKENKIAVYGGSFNPPTNWHKFVIESIFTKTNVEKIILNPDGPRLDKDFKIESHHRENMIEMFAADLRKSWFDIDVDKYFFSGKNGRDTTIMQVKEYYKEILWFEPNFVFGTDVINAMPNWKDNENQYIEKQLSKIFIKRPWSEYDLSWFENYKIIDTKLVDISSTKVKEELSKNKNLVSELIIPEIRHYILSNNLYI